MSARGIEPADDYLVGVADGRQDMAADAVATLMAAEARERELRDSLLELRNALRLVKGENVSLRKDRFNHHVQVTRCIGVTAVLVFLATYNACVQGWLA